MAALTVEEMAALLPELQRELQGLALSHVTTPSRRLFILTFARHRRLLVSCEMPFLRAHLVRKRYPTKRTPFCRRLEKTLLGHKLDQVDLLNEDRILSLQFDNAQLVAELLPKRPNLLLLHEGEVIESLNPREAPYQLPPKPSHEMGPILTLTSEEVEERYECALANQLFQEAHRHALTASRGRIKQCSRQLTRLKEQLARAGQWEAIFCEAELLQANIARLHKGLNTLVVEDWHRNGDERELTLDPKLNPADLVAARFKEARRAKRAIPHLTRLITEKEADLEALREEHTQLEAATSIEQLPEVAPKPKGAVEKRPFRRFLTAEGLEILVGRSDRENDQLTFAHAHGSDWWLHAQDFPGAHVVIRVARKQAPHSESLQDALQLAAFFSRAKEETVVDICVTQRKHLQRAKGGKLGQVWVSKHQVVPVRRDEKRLQAIRERKS